MDAQTEEKEDTFEESNADFEIFLCADTAATSNFLPCTNIVGSVRSVTIIYQLIPQLMLTTTTTTATTVATTTSGQTGTVLGGSDADKHI